ncbi:hypothetical protein Cadr_000012980 [Camelus dromedarius]|uniref:Uncharacterized protein n=1 Tax=Camelus dromedarius TaxID=9838 RepID=A0A5N4D949_CAMDR|nr:hypothetical protein Cadr_000012980 [Camelus dromedarius]
MIGKSGLKYCLGAEGTAQWSRACLVCPSFCAFVVAAGIF